MDGKHYCCELVVHILLPLTSRDDSRSGNSGSIYPP